MGLLDNNGDPTGLEVRERETCENKMNSGCEMSVFMKFPRLILVGEQQKIDLIIRPLGLRGWQDQSVASRSVAVVALYVNLLARIHEAKLGHIESASLSGMEMALQN